MAEPLAFQFFVPGDYDRDYHCRLAAEAPFYFSPRVPESERDEFPKRIGYLFPVPVPLEGESLRRGSIIGREAGGARCSFSPCGSDLTDEQRTRIFDTVEPKSFLFLRMAGLEINDRRAGRSQVRGWSKQCSPLRDRSEITCSRSTSGGTMPQHSRSARRSGWKPGRLPCPAMS